MKAPQRVVWSEGMLVSPQHLQQQDLYHERLLDERIAALAPYRWGVVVGRGRSRARSAPTSCAHALRRHPARRPAPWRSRAATPSARQARPIGAHFPPTQPSCDVYLAVPKEREGVPSVSAEQEAPAAAGSTDGGARALPRVDAAAWPT